MKKRPGVAHLKIFFMHTQKHFQPIYKVQRAQVADLIQKEAPVATMSAMRGPSYVPRPDDLCVPVPRYLAQPPFPFSINI